MAEQDRDERPEESNPVEDAVVDVLTSGEAVVDGVTISFMGNPGEKIVVSGEHGAIVQDQNGNWKPVGGPPTFFVKPPSGAGVTVPAGEDPQKWLDKHYPNASFLPHLAVNKQHGKSAAATAAAHIPVPPGENTKEWLAKHYPTVEDPTVWLAKHYPKPDSILPVVEHSAVPWSQPDATPLEDLTKFAAQYITQPPPQFDAIAAFVQKYGTHGQAVQKSLQKSGQAAQNVAKAMEGMGAGLSYVDEVVKLANFPGDGVDNVATPAGAKYYGQPIGSVIVKDAAGKVITGDTVVPVRIGGKLKTSGPAGSEVYLYKNTDPDSATIAKFLHVKGEDGGWFKVTAAGTTELSNILGKAILKQVESGSMVKDPTAKPVDKQSLGKKKTEAKKDAPKVSPEGQAAIKDYEEKKAANKAPVSDAQKAAVLKSVKDGTAPKIKTADQVKKDYEAKKTAQPDGPSKGQLASFVDKLGKGLTPQAPDTGAPKALVGGIAVTADEMIGAANVLLQQPGIYVKQPLQKVKHPLAEMDYHAVAATVQGDLWENQPVAGKTKKKVVQALQDTAAKLKAAPPAPPQNAAAATAIVGGVQVTQKQILEAVDILVAQKGKYVKQPLQAKKHPLEAMDYHAVAKSASGKDDSVTGPTKQAVVHKLKDIAAKLEGQAAAQPGTAPAPLVVGSDKPLIAEHTTPFPGSVQIGALHLLPGKYMKAGGKAHLLLYPDGTATYTNAKGVTKKETPNGFTWQHSAQGGGLSWYAGPDATGTVSKAPAAGTPAATHKPASFEEAVADAKAQLDELKKSQKAAEKKALPKPVIPTSFLTGITALNEAKKLANKTGKPTWVVVDGGNDHWVYDVKPGDGFASTTLIEPTATPEPESSFLVKQVLSESGYTLYPQAKAAAQAEADKTGLPLWVGTAHNKQKYVFDGPPSSIDYDPISKIEPSAAKPADKPVPAPPAPPAPQLVPAGSYAILDEFGLPLKLDIHADGSGLFHSASKGEIPYDKTMVDSLLKAGHVVDDFGTSILVDGNTAEDVHFLGGEKWNVATLKQFAETSKEAMGQGAGAWLDNFESFYLAPETPFNNAIAFAKAQPDYSVGSMKTSVQAKAQELLHKLEGGDPGPGQVVHPPNAPSFKQVGVLQFDTATGYAQPFTGANGPVYDSSAAKARIDAISQQFGDGKVVGKGASQMSVTERMSWLKAWNSGDLKAAYEIEAEKVKKPSALHPGAPGNPGTHKVEWGPAVAGEVPAGTPVMPKLPDEWQWPKSWVDNYLVKANMAHPEQLSESDRRTWVKYHQQGKKSLVDQYSLVAAKRHADGKAPLTDIPTYTKDLETPKAYTSFLEKKAPPETWLSSALQAYVVEHDLVPGYTANSIKFVSQSLLANKISEHLANVTPAEPLTAKQQATSDGKLLLTDLGEKLVVPGTNAGVKLVKDQFGGQWVWKPAKYGEDYRADVEHGALTLSKLWGFQAPDSKVIDHEGSYGLIQQRILAKKSLSGVNLTSLSQKQLGQVVREHVLDWGLNNDDSHGGNFLQTGGDLLIDADGDVIGIDKGRAWRNFGDWKGAVSTEEMNSNAQLVYADLYGKIKAGKFDQKSVDSMYRTAKNKAASMSKLDDATMTEVLEKAFAQRPFGEGIKGPKSKQDLIDAALARKNALPADIEKLWDEIYEELPYEKPVVDTSLVNNQGHQLHAGFTSEYLSNVSKTKNFGTATFFAGTDLEDSHVLTWREKLPLGNFRLRSEAKVRGGKLIALENWLASRAVDKTDEAGGPSELPLEGHWYQSIINGAKTVSYHAMDGNYNAHDLAQMELTKNALIKVIPKYEEAGDSSAVEMAKKYLGYIEGVETHKANKTKSFIGEYPRHSYVPPAKDEKIQPGVVVQKVAAHTWKSGDFEAGLDDNGELTLKKKGPDTKGHQGNMYEVILPTGEVIEFRGENTTQTPLAQQGLMRFSIPDEVDGAVGLERIRAQLTTMGLDLQEASSTDLELFYWRHLAGVMRERKDSGPLTADPQYQPMWKNYDKKLDGKGTDAELEMWRKAFAAMTDKSTVDKFVASGGYLPKFSHFDIRNPDQPNGKPYWERFDVADEEVFEMDFPTSTTGFHKFGSEVVRTGGMFSTEARVRALAIDVGATSMSSHADMGYGSSGFVFTRLNRFGEIFQGDAGVAVMFNPKTLRRTSNYSFNSDKFGRIKERKTYSPFALKGIKGFKSGGNETMIKDSMSLMDDIEILAFKSEADRLDAIKRMAKLGITDIRGVSVADRFVVWDDDYSGKQEKIKALKVSIEKARKALKKK